MSSNIDYRKNYYEVLGVKRDATQKEIKSAFYGLSKKYHPDVTGASANSTLTARFIAIKEAYDVLKDEGTRRDYDQHRAQTSTEYVRQRYASQDYKRTWGYTKADDPFRMRREWPYHNDEFFRKVFEEIRRRAEAERLKTEEEARAWRRHYRQQWRYAHSERPTMRLAFERMLANSLKPFLPLINTVLVVYLIAFFLVSLYRVTSRRQNFEADSNGGEGRVEGGGMTARGKYLSDMNHLENVAEISKRINEMVAKPPPYAGGT